MTTTKDEITMSAGTAAPAAPVAEPAPPPVPPELLERAGDTGEELLERFKTGLQNRRDEEAEQRQALAQQLGQPRVGPYVAFDLYAFSPIQFGGPPPYQPSKIIAAGEWAVIYTVMFVNPQVDIANGFAVPPTTQLRGRRYRVTMEQVNLTNVTNGPDDFRPGRFVGPVSPFTLIPFWFRAPFPVRKPQFFEANLAVDIIDAGQPYAAFASTIIDVDSGRVQENIPLRYLVYPE
ncbi:hypothetical protein M1L60_27320 [Actinoplanes sp. TRM 88003]|uniref:Uncharacterized protein n=1 Tax=Paractinoplanes aksuensis TaxID=2939490 RepID=A0ABT1DXF9_9ACTN|nr:hypothetical protein [Actinoplanes aksuensis]MCO8274316.1 hypothetical protein [Actinoplanes aksuensis]